MNKDFWDKVTELEDLANKATPGPWKADEHFSGVDTAYMPGLKANGAERVDGFSYGLETFICDLNDGENHEYTDYEEQKANCQFIAAANPAMIQEMIAIFKSRISYLEHKLTETDIQLGNAQDMVKQLEKEADWLAEELASVYKSEFECTMDLLDASGWRKEARKAVMENKNV